MNRSIPRRLGDSRQYRPLSQFARCIADRLWRRGVVQRWASEDELIDYMQQCGLFLGLARLEEWPPVFAELTASGFLVDEGEAIVLPILTADTLRVAPPAAEPTAAEARRLRDKAFSMHLMRRARSGDARAILARNEEGTFDRDEAAAMLAVLEAEYHYPSRARRRGNKGSVTTAEQADGTAPATAAVPVPRASSLSPSPGSGVQTPEPQRDGEFRSAREATAFPGPVTDPSVTTPAPVTDPVPATPSAPRSAEELARAAPADVGQFFLDVMALRAPGTFPAQVDAVDAAKLGRMIVARGASEADVRAIGARWRHDPAASRMPFVYQGSGVTEEGPIPLSLLLGARTSDGYDGGRFGRLRSEAVEWVKGLAARGHSVSLSAEPPFRVGVFDRPGVVGTVDGLLTRRVTGSG